MKFCDMSFMTELNWPPAPIRPVYGRSSKIVHGRSRGRDESMALHLKRSMKVVHDEQSMDHIWRPDFLSPSLHPQIRPIQPIDRHFTSFHVFHTTPRSRTLLCYYSHHRTEVGMDQEVLSEIGQRLARAEVCKSLFPLTILTFDLEECLFSRRRIR